MGRTHSQSVLAKHSIKQIREKIRIARERRDYFIRYLQEMWNDYRQGKVSKEFCIKTEYKKLDGKTIREWIVYYDAYIKKCENLILKYKKDVIKGHFLLIFISAIIILLLAFSLYQIQPRFVGFFVQETQPITTGILGEENLTIQTTQASAVLGQPVKWIKTVSLDEPTSFRLTLPGEAENITVKKISYSETQGALRNQTSPLQEEPLVSEPETESGAIFTTITGAVISETSEGGFLTRFFRNIGRITGFAIVQEPAKQVTIEDNGTEYEIEYETPAPYSTEQEIARGKQVKIIGPEAIHYENVLAFTQLDESLNIKNPSQIKIYWHENNSYITPVSVQDRDSNGIYDYVEWVAPSLSTQTFSIIVITKAEHLDSNKDFISDIYDEVKELDGNWSETINNNEYVRVTFEIPLDNTRDITIFPRITSGSPKIEVYEIGSDFKIAEFTNIISNQYNKVLLTNLQNQQETFDLKITGGSIEIEHIIDPTVIFLTSGTSWTVPTDWSNDNTIEVIGGAGGGRTGAAPNVDSAGRGGGGGGGGGYSKVTNVTSLTAGNSVTIQVGTGGTGGATPTAGGDTFLCNATTNCASITGTAVVVGAKNGSAGTTIAGGAGGDAVSGVGTIKFSGGNGGGSGTVAAEGGSGGGGGGGGGGSTGAGNIGATSANVGAVQQGSAGGTGGSGDVGSGGAGGTGGTGGPRRVNGGVGGNGGNGTEWQVSPAYGSGGGAGGGGGGGSEANGGAAGISGTYGAGGAGGGGPGIDPPGTAAAGSSGKGGLIVITYTPAASDTIAPIASFGTNPANNVNRSNSSVTFDLKGSDNVALSYLRLFGNWTGSWVANQTNTSPINETYWNITVDAIPNGKYIWAAWANDTSNNQTFTTTNRTFTIDTVAPTITLPFYANGTRKLNNETLTLNISVSDATTNPSACKIDINGTNQTVSVSSGWCNITNGFLTNLADGNRTINVYANDSTGQFGLNNSFVVFMDSNAPVPQFGTNPADNINRSNSSVTFDLRAYDGVFVNYLSLYGNWTGSWVANQTNTSPINDTFWNITVDNIPQGKYRWAAWANDSHNNQAFTATNRTFTIDTVAPIITLPFYVNGTQKFNNETLTLNISVTDATTNPSACKIEANGTNTTVAVSSGWCNTTSIPLTNLAAGNRTINVYANDSANNFGLNNSFVVDILASNAAPTIPFIQAISDQNVSEAGTRNVVFNFSVNDTDGSSNINVSSARAQFNQTGETTRSNASCINISSGGNGVVFSCTIGMLYFDNSGVWTINVSARDNSEASAENSTTNFTYNLLTAMVIAPASLAWPSPINLTDTNISSNNDPVLINNTGNALNLSINVTAFNLRGEGDTSKFIFANNFTIGNVTDGCGAGINASIMANATSLKVNSTNLSRGNNTLNFGNETSGQEQLFFCLRGVPQDISAQSYSSSFYGSWTITVLLVALIPANRKRKKKQKEDNKLLDALDLIIDRIKEDSGLRGKEITEKIIERLMEKYDISKKGLLDLIGEKTNIPISIFSKNLGVLEALAKYMKENLKMAYSEIARSLSRDERTIWTAYKKATEKQKEPFKIKAGIMVPISTFENKELTTLESLILYLKEKGLKFSEIAEILERDQRNIWTICSRAKKKTEKFK